jgi:hypothetical protein
MNEAADIQTLATRVVYEHRWMRVREDSIRRRDGSDGIYGVVEKPDFVVIVPVEQDRSLHLVQQFRYPVGARYWELPQGLLGVGNRCRSVAGRSRRAAGRDRPRRGGDFLRRPLVSGLRLFQAGLPHLPGPQALAALKRHATWRSKTSSRALSP